MIWTGYLPDYKPSTTKTGRFRELRNEHGKKIAKIVEVNVGDNQKWICTVYLRGSAWSSTVKMSEELAKSTTERMVRQ